MLPRAATAAAARTLAPPHHSLTPVHAPQVDPDLSPLQAVQEWAAEGNPPGQRVAYIMSIPAAAAECSLAEARLVLLPLLAQLVFDDHPDIKQATAEVLGPLGARTEACVAWQRCWAAPRVLLQRLPCTGVVLRSFETGRLFFTDATPPSHPCIHKACAGQPQTGCRG